MGGLEVDTACVDNPVERCSLIDPQDPAQPQEVHNKYLLSGRIK